jgi:hypothetical protein
MEPDATSPTIAADDVGIHLLHGGKDIVVGWGEIAQICGLREKYADGTPFIQVFIDQQTIPVVWKRDEVVQPFQLRPSMVDSRDPTPEERVQMQAAHQASIDTCEKVLGRRLEAEEIACVRTAFENGRIVGSVAAPLCQLLVERQNGE